MQEQGNRGEAGWVGVGWRAAGGVEGVIKSRSCVVVVIYACVLACVCVCVCVCVPDLEPDRVAGMVEVMRGPRGRWVKMISGKQPPANQTHLRDTQMHTHNAENFSL